MSDRPPVGEPEPRGEQPTDHIAEGLELARQQARAVAKARPATGSAPIKRRDRTQRRKVPRQGGGLSGPRPDDRDPQPIDSLVERLVADHGWEVDLRVQGIFARWPELVGGEIAEHSHPESIDEGRLVVRTDSTAWATQLRLLAASLVRRLNEELGHETVRLVEVKGPDAPSWKRGRRVVKGRGPRDTYG